MGTNKQAKLVWTGPEVLRIYPDHEVEIICETEARITVRDQHRAGAISTHNRRTGLPIGAKRERGLGFVGWKIEIVDATK